MSKETAGGRGDRQQTGQRRHRNGGQVGAAVGVEHVQTGIAVVGHESAMGLLIDCRRHGARPTVTVRAVGRVDRSFIATTLTAMSSATLPMLGPSLTWERVVWTWQDHNERGRSCAWGLQ